MKTAAEAIGITYYELPRIKGTRFVSHRYRGFFRLLHMLPALGMANSNYLNEKKSESVKAKVQNIIKKLRSSSTICRIAAIMDIFQIMQPTSLVFEGEGLMPYDVKPTIDIAVEQLREIAEGNGDVPLDSHLRFFKFTACDGAGVSLTREYCKSGHEKHQTTNRECIQVEMTGITGFSDEIMKQAVRTIQQVAKDLMKILRERFADFEDPILLSMQWLDPKYWTDLKDYGIDQILNLYDHFKVPLDEAGFNANRVGREWRLLRAFITSFYVNAVLKNPLSLEKIWQNIIKFRQNEYPNVCLLVSLLFWIKLHS